MMLTPNQDPNAPKPQLTGFGVKQTRDCRATSHWKP